MLDLINRCPRGAHTCARPLFCCCDVEINPMTFKLECDLDILTTYHRANNEVARLRHSKLLELHEISRPMSIKSEKKKKYENDSQSQMSPTFNHV